MWKYEKLFIQVSCASVENISKKLSKQIPRVIYIELIGFESAHIFKRSETIQTWGNKSYH